MDREQLVQLEKLAVKVVGRITLEAIARDKLQTYLSRSRTLDPTTLGNRLALQFKLELEDLGVTDLTKLDQVPAAKFKGRPLQQRLLRAAKRKFKQS